MTFIAIATVIGIAIGLALILSVALADAIVETSSSAIWTAGNLFLSPRLPDRPRGVQEEDLPPFVFRDRPAPVHARSSVSAHFGQPAPVGS